MEQPPIMSSRPRLFWLMDESQKLVRRTAPLEGERAQIERLLHQQSAEMAERWPPGMIKRWPGYGLKRFLRSPQNLNEILAGSEGTLAAIFSAELKISPLPREKGLGLIFFRECR